MHRLAYNSLWNLFHTWFVRRRKSKRKTDEEKIEEKIEEAVDKNKPMQEAFNKATSDVIDNKRSDPLVEYYEEREEMEKLFDKNARNIVAF